MVRKRLRELGLAGLGLAVIVKEKAKNIGRKLIHKGKKNEKRVLSQGKSKLRSGARFAGREALIISKKSLQILEKELKKLEARAKKTQRVAKKIVVRKTSKKRR